MASQPEGILLIGIQASGKSTFARQHLGDTHVRINLDMLHTRRKEALLFEACLRGPTPFVVDNTNATRHERAMFIPGARDAGFSVTGYYFQSEIGQALDRNAQRPGPARIPDAGVKSTHARLELPSWGEGFDRLFYVRTIGEPGAFDITEWRDEV